MHLQDAVTLMCLFAFGHYLADFPWQGAYLAQAKNRFQPLAGTPWYHALAAHAVIHGGVVGIISGSLWLGLAETMIHALIDDRKCAGLFGYNTDQALHILCKLVWVALIWSGVVPLTGIFAQI